MKSAIAICVLCGLVACVSEHAELRNANGQVVNCANEGWGWLGAPVAAANQSNCIKKAEAAGFQRQGIPQAASSPAVPAPAAATPASGTLPSFIEPVSTSMRTEVSTVTPAPAPASVPAAAAAPAAPAPIIGSPAERLKKLEDVYKAGLMTKEEYDRKRQEIMATL